MVTRRNIVHSAVFLNLHLLATAGIFLQLQAEFLFVVQIILYVGGIMVLFIFVIIARESRRRLASNPIQSAKICGRRAHPGPCGQVFFDFKGQHVA